jgi:hypothetical protein
MAFILHGVLVAVGSFWPGYRGVIVFPVSAIILSLKKISCK